MYVYMYVCMYVCICKYVYVVTPRTDLGHAFAHVRACVVHGSRNPYQHRYSSRSLPLSTTCARLSATLIKAGSGFATIFLAVLSALMLSLMF